MSQLPVTIFFSSNTLKNKKNARRSFLFFPISTVNEAHEWIDSKTKKKQIK